LFLKNFSKSPSADEAMLDKMQPGLAESKAVFPDHISEGKKILIFAN
jgi:hypothetical protein